MRTSVTWRWLCLTILIAGISGVAVRATTHSADPLPVKEPQLAITLPSWARLAAAADGTPHQAPSGSVFSAQQPPKDEESGLSASSLAAASDPLQVFTNTWSYSTIGLVYDSARDLVRYAHESQSSTHRPTIYDVDAASHTLVYSLALSSANSGWPWQIDNRTGAAYDFSRDTYLMPDYNGDLSYADDNIVEVRTDGTILNAWEMDDEVGSNDSADGSEIDSIIDIAVVPGNPTRYFVTAAYDDAVVYEIVLTRTGTLWTPNSWYTVMTYTLPTLTDNLGIDYDAEHEVLYHSGWHTTTILITDLSMNPITWAPATFDCPGQGGYNSGVTYIEGSDPPEVWVTDFSSDQTTRCEVPLPRETTPAAWAKWVADQPWEPGTTIETQTGQVFLVTDVITAMQPFTLTETWDPERLALVGVDVLPAVGEVLTGTGSLRVVVPGGPPEVMTIEKRFFVEPCTWTSTLLTETLVVEEETPFEARPVTITKLSPELWIGNAHETEVYAGGIASFTLTYSNTGGFENGVWISSTFPITAPFAFAEPFPDQVGPDGNWTRWDIGDLAMDGAGSIEVFVTISETAPTSSTMLILSGIFDHVDVVRGETPVAFHATQESFAVEWTKWINGEPWHPGMSVRLETSQTLTVEEAISVPALEGFSLIEEWDANHLYLLPGWTVASSTPVVSATVTRPGLWSLEVPPGSSGAVITVTKVFRVEPCTWGETVLWETLIGGTEGIRTRPVIVGKEQPELWIDGSYGANVYGGQETEFVLHYGNAGGLESQAWISSTFPSTARFLDSAPAPAAQDLDGRWALWNAGTLGRDDEGQIVVAVGIRRGLPPSTTIGIWSGILNHVEEAVGETGIFYHVPPPTWEKWVNGVPWTLDTAARVQTGDLITITEIISTRSAMAIVEHWNVDRLSLSEYAIEPQAGIVLSDTGFLSWEFPGGAPGEIAITKIFAVRPFTETYTVIWEALWVEDVEWARRPVHIDRMQLIYAPTIMRNYGE